MPIFWTCRCTSRAADRRTACVAGRQAASKLSMSAAAPSADEWLGRLVPGRVGQRRPAAEHGLGQQQARRSDDEGGGAADARVIDALEALEFSWTSPPTTTTRCGPRRCARFEVYRREHGDGQKKYKLDQLGGWVAAVRRNRSPSRLRRSSTRSASSGSQRGSAAMAKLREFREFFAPTGTPRSGACWATIMSSQVVRELARSCAFSKKRATYLIWAGSRRVGFY